MPSVKPFETAQHDRWRQTGRRESSKLLPDVEGSQRPTPMRLSTGRCREMDGCVGGTVSCSLQSAVSPQVAKRGRDQWGRKCGSAFSVDLLRPWARTRMPIKLANPSQQQQQPCGRTRARRREHRRRTGPFASAGQKEHGDRQNRSVHHAN